jgi:hypothetical protein
VIVTVPNPVSETVGYDPTLPVIVVVPVLVIPEYASTAKDPAAPRLGAVAAEALCSVPYAPNIPATSRAVTASTIMLLFGIPLSVFVKSGRNSDGQERHMRK